MVVALERTHHALRSAELLAEMQLMCAEQERAEEVAQSMN